MYLIKRVSNIDGEHTIIKYFDAKTIALLMENGLTSTETQRYLIRAFYRLSSDVNI